MFDSVWIAFGGYGAKSGQVRTSAGRSACWLAGTDSLKFELREVSRQCGQRARRAKNVR